MLIALALLAPVTAAQAAPYTVNSSSDAVDNTLNGVCSVGAPTGGPCSLRAAVQEANKTPGVADTITLPSGSFPLSIGGAGENAAATGDIDITDSVTIQGVGSGASGTAIQGAPNPSERIFETLGATTSVTLANLRLTGANDPNTVSGIVGNGLSLTLSGVVVTANTGDGIIQQVGPGSASAPSFTMVNSAVSGNISTGSVMEVGPTGIGRANFSDSAITDNTLNGAGGFPAILTLDNGTNDSRVNLTRMTLSGNMATAAEGVIDFDPSGGQDSDGDHLTIADSVFSNNTLSGGAGAILFDPAASGGPGNTPMNLSLTRTRFVNNTNTSDGGAINSAPSGGVSPSLTARDSTFQGNVAGNGGSGGGGAIHFAGADGSSLTVTGSTFSGNRAGTAAGDAEGGAIDFNIGRATMSITNSTFSNNSVPAGTLTGGGAINYEPAIVGSTGTLTNVTMVGNSTEAGGEGGGIRIDTPTLKPTLRNTIIQGNTDGGAPSDCSSAAISGGGNLEGAATCSLTAAADQRNINPLLGPLADNGGPTLTRALGMGSPAFNRALATNCPSRDQRGIARPQGAGCDIGAFELAVAATRPGTTLPPPVLGKLVNAEVISGKVFVSLPPRVRAALSVPGLKGRKFVPLVEARQIPVGSLLDTRNGKVRLTSASTSKGKTFTGDFETGVFQVLQSRKKKAKGLTELRLKGASFKRCRASKGAEVSASRSKRTIRRLRSKAKGRFRTRGRYSAATVRGTSWLTADRCDGTLTKVTRGKVAVRDFRRRKTILVKAGKRYLARARG